MSNVSTRITKLEKTIRKAAREEFVKSVGDDFAAAVARASGNNAALTPLLDAHDYVIKAGAKKAEDAALERFLAEKAPAVSPIYYVQPQLVRLDASGKRLADDDSAEHIAVLVPRWTPTHDLLIDARAPTPIDRIGTGGEKAAQVASKIELFGEPIRLLSDKEWEPIIDRTKRDPAVHPFFSKTSPTDRWYPTSTPHLNTDGTPSGCVWAVYLRYGSVASLDGDSYGGGFVRGGRLVPASQF